MRRLSSLLITLFGLLPALALAWGEQGHRITGQVARSLLTPQAMAGVKALLGNTDLAAASLYLDQHKLELNNRIPGSRLWHYDDRPVCDAKAPKAEWCPNGNCASVQIVRHYRALIDAHAGKDEKRLAVQALVHLVGDVHQPLHASDHDDRGGNDVHVHFTLPKGGRRSIDLHSAWDTIFLQSAFDTVDDRKIAQALLKATDAVQIKAWQKGSADSWLKESYGIANELAYGQLPGFQCSAEDFAEQPLDLDAAYVARARELIPVQLVKAGARIAYLLNRAFAD